jgi:hypothetical protein
VITTENSVSVSQRAVPNEDVIVTPLDEGEAVLLHLATRKYFSLNSTGLAIWRGLDEGLSIEEVSRCLVADYSISEDHALAAVRRLITELRDADLVHVPA